MDESFEVRVKRLFGSRLFESVPGNSFPASSWSVADGEVERREWNRGAGAGAADDDDGGGPGGAAADRGDTPCSAAFGDPAGCFARRARSERRRLRRLGADLEADLDDLDDADEDGEGGGGGGDGDGEGEGEGEGDGDREEREIRSSVGLDPTLDNEEEEDEFDRAAFGTERARDRLYMGEVKDRGRHISILTVVPELFDDDDSDLFYRDPRADHDAANARLMEDDKSAKKEPSLSVHGSSRPKIIPEDEANLKPILKRKEHHSDEKPKKRVRFDSELLERTEHCNNAMKEENPSAPSEPSRVPDYILNPSKYTKYTLDSSDSTDDEMNKQAFEDFRNLMDRLNPNNNTQTQTDIPAELTKSITFIPRKKLGGGDDAMCIDQAAATHTKVVSSNSSGSSMFIAAEDAPETDVCEMEEDRAEASAGEVGVGSSKKPARRYRAKPADDSG